MATPSLGSLRTKQRGARLKQARAALKRVEMERDISKKVVAIFPQPPQSWGSRYNAERQHSVLGYQTPNYFETQLKTTSQLCPG